MQRPVAEPCDPGGERDHHDADDDHPDPTPPCGGERRGPARCGAALGEHVIVVAGSGVPGGHGRVGSEAGVELRVVEPVEAELARHHDGVGLSRHRRAPVRRSADDESAVTA